MPPPDVLCLEMCSASDVGLGWFRHEVGREINGRPAWRHTTQREVWLARVTNGWRVMKHEPNHRLGAGQELFLLADTECAFPSLSRVTWKRPGTGSVYRAEPTLTCRAYDERRADGAASSNTDLEERLTTLLLEKEAAEAECVALRRMAEASRAAEGEVDSLRARMSTVDLQASGGASKDGAAGVLRAELEAAHATELATVRGEGPAMDALPLGELQRLLEQAQQSVQRLQARVDEKQAEERTCAICLTAPKNTVIDPCGHCVCAGCARKLTACHICRGPITKLLRTYN